MRCLVSLGLGLTTSLLACGGLYAIEELPPSPADAANDAAPAVENDADVPRDPDDAGARRDGGETTIGVDAGSDAGLATPWPSLLPVAPPTVVSSACLRVPAGLSPLPGVHVLSVYQGSGGAPVRDRSP